MAVHQAPEHVWLTINSCPLIGRKSAHGQFDIFITVTLIGSLMVSQGQRGAIYMWPLKTITHRHGGSEPLPSAEGSGGGAYQPSTKGCGGEAGQPSTEGSGGEKVNLMSVQ